MLCACVTYRLHTETGYLLSHVFIFEDDDIVPGPVPGSRSNCYVIGTKFVYRACGPELMSSMKYFTRGGALKEGRDWLRFDGGLGQRVYYMRLRR